MNFLAMPAGAVNLGSAGRALQPSYTDQQYGAFGLGPTFPNMSQPVPQMSMGSISAPGRQQIPLNFMAQGSQPLIPDFSSLTQQRVDTPRVPTVAEWNKQNGKGGGIGSNAGELGFNTPTIQLGLQGLQTLAGMYLGFQNLGLAKKQFKIAREVTDTNLNNQIKNYNTSLEDRARARAAFEGQSDSERDAYVEKNKVSRASTPKKK